MKTHLDIQLQIFPLTKPRKFVAAKEKQHNYLHHRKMKADNSQHHTSAKNHQHFAGSK